VGELVFLELLGVSNGLIVATEESHHLLLDERLESVDLAVVLSLDKLDLSESALSDDLEGRKVLRPLLGPQEAQVFDLSASHAVLLLCFPVVRNGGLLQDRLKLQSPATTLVMLLMGHGKKAYLWFRSRARWTLSLKNVVMRLFDMVACLSTLSEYFSGWRLGASSS
jgi:hypothetical protein